ncbi:coiled-coil domain-containing protein 137 [Eupeodes corollae]|uniref:coiled-coil domain-containing protein 137 n=1 Tax=Eupeodes corollae TaxID=290404 RepID=UPI0024909318|nr:coiled-coil domain-containing protein 137 [Eupeodes corollae]
MVRKRKIPARKHHGIRDPIKQKSVQLAKLKNVTNNPPVKGGKEKLSKKFAEFVKLANAAQSGKKMKRIHRGIEDKPKETTQGKGKSKTTNANTGSKIRPIKQLANETDEDYIRRVNRMTTESLKEAEYEAKYGVTVVRDAKTGAISIKKKPTNEIDEMIKRKKSGKPLEKSGVIKMDPKEAKALIKQAIREDNEESKKEGLQEFKRDVFKFGEVVHAPPTLSTLPRKAVRSETVPRPGKKDNLLLKSMLKSTTKESIPKVATEAQQAQKAPRKFKGKLKGKLKDLPPVTRAMIEKEQNKVIDMYRQLKKNKQSL